MFLRMVYDEKLAQAAYVIGCQKTGEAIVVDPQRDVDRYTTLAATNGLRVVAVAETHIHADFVSGARELAERGARVYVSDEGDADWKYQWLGKKSGGGSYDHQLVRDGDTFRVGNIGFRVLHTPGHTPEHVCFLVTDHGGGADAPMGVLTGDFVFVGDLGRPDLLETAAGQAGAMEPSARRLFQSVQRLGELPEYLQVWPAHGAGSACGKALGAVPTSTVGYEQRFNPAIRAARTEQGFVDFILSGQPEPPLYFANMKRDNKVGPKVLGGVPAPRQMRATDLRSVDAKRVAILDTRPWEAFRAAHVPGSLSFPLAKSFNTDAGSMVRDTEDIVLVVAPARLDEAVRDLIRVGLDRFLGWVDASEIESYEGADHPMAHTDEVSVDEGERMIADAGTRVLDVRRMSEFELGCLPGAINIAHTRLASRTAEVARDGRWLVNCRSGFRSARACAYLQRAGYQVVNLAGGYLAWEQHADAVGR